MKKTAKQQKALMKILGIRRPECMKMAVYRDSLVAKVLKCVDKRDYEGAEWMLSLVTKAQDCIEANQNTLDAIDKASR